MTMTTYWDGSYPPSVLHPEPPPPAATGVTPGSPGSWTPAGAAPPANLAAANALGYSGPAWSVGQYVVLGDASEAHWSGVAFVAGRAPLVELGDETSSTTSTAGSRKRRARDEDW